jgi:hypothetical protein
VRTPRWKKSGSKQATSKAVQQVEQEDGTMKQPLARGLAENEQLLRTIFEKCSDLVFRPLSFGEGHRLLLVYVDGLADTKHLDEIVLQPLLYQGLPQGLKSSGLGAWLEGRVAVGQTKTVEAMADVVKHVLRGEVVVLAEGDARALVLSLQGGKQRSVEEPITESVIRGPREGFNENLRINTSLLRRRIRSSKLKLESLTIGEVTQTDVAIAYLDGICDDAMVKEVYSRVQRIQIDGVLESGYVEEMIEDEPFSPFPQMHYTERPDVVVASLLEGRVAILIDGTPDVLIVPVTMWGSLNANEDYYERYMMVSFVRWIRMLFVLIALLLPSVYVAVTTYHHEMLPTNLLLSIAGAREESPFPAFIEAMIMEVTFEALREAGVRLPKPVGQAVSIVGALVIGQAAVQADIVSAPLVIVVSITGIASFTIPRYNFAIAIRLLRFPMIVLAGTLGLYGITIGLLAILIHLSSLRSMGIPYLYPVAPLNLANLNDVFLHAPWWRMNMRPRLMGYRNHVRIPKGQMPKPPDDQQTGENEQKS